MNGPAFMAIRAQLPIIPMALIGTYELLPIHSCTIHKVPVTLAIGEEDQNRRHDNQRGERIDNATGGTNRRAV